MVLETSYVRPWHCHLVNQSNCTCCSYLQLWPYTVPYAYCKQHFFIDSHCLMSAVVTWSSWTPIQIL